MWPALIAVGANFLSAIFGGPKKPDPTTIAVVAKFQADQQAQLLQYYYIPGALVLVGGLILAFSGGKKE